MDIQALVAKIEELDRYDPCIKSGCPCCEGDGYASMEQYSGGDYVNYYDLQAIIKEFKDGNSGT